MLVTANNLCVGFGHYPFAGLLNDTQAEALTRGPEYNWFGYYDKLHVDPSGRYVLGTTRAWGWQQGCMLQWIPGSTQELYLFHIPSNRKVILGRFYSPPDYTGEWRCDLHPKCTTDGRKVIFDSTHGGDGRQIDILDINAVMK